MTDLGPALEQQVMLSRPGAPPQTLASALYEVELDYVCCSLRRLGIRSEDLEDLAHEVFIRALRALNRFDARRPLRPWLFAIAFHVAVDFKRRPHHREEVDQAEALDHPDQAASPEAETASRQERDLVLRALEAIEPNRRAVFVMHEIDGYGAPEIAEALGIPLNTVYSRLRVARQEFAESVKRLSAKGGER